jgi:uroporphyrinogen III methyltransferase/synthase
MIKPIVYIIGAGSGDINLLTLKAKDILEKADVILYDRLINPLILKFANDKAILDYVGKENIESGKSQDKINQKLVDYAKKYNIIVRLKGGDPYLFGRGAEEALYLFENNIDFEIIPGISSLIAATSYAGIPITHRNFASEVHVFTGHNKNNDLNLDLKKISELDGTVIFFMAVKNIEKIIDGLLKHDKPASTKIAVIENGSTNKQRITKSTLGDFLKQNIKERIIPPAIFVIGEVVGLENKLNWISKKPLFGKNIMVTRAKAQVSTFSLKLIEQGANVIELPFIKFEDLSIKKINENFVKNIKNYSAILFNSGNGVNYFFNKLYSLEYDLRVLGNCRIGVVGEGTKREIKKYNVLPDIIPDQFTVEELIKEASKKISGKILVVTSDISPVNPDKIKDQYNIDIEKIEIYSTKNEVVDLEKFKDYLEDLDIITFMSSSTVESFNYYYQKLDEHHKQKINNIDIVSIGPMTTKILNKYNFKVNIEAQKYSIDGMIEALKKKYKVV